jgi:tyrosyl-tRNA synthetase
MLDFLRDVGKHITVNQMMAKDSVKSRISDGNGLSYTEFSYMLLQANDFRHLCEHHQCEMQMGGSDQWGNITAGTELIRKTLSRSAYGLTWPLITKADGTKFGKTADGAVWLDARRTSPYQFRQFWMQIADADIEHMLPKFSLRSMSEIAEILADQKRTPESRVAQRTLARELTVMLHGEEAADAAEQAREFKGQVKLAKIVKDIEVREDVVDAIYRALQSFDRQFVEETLTHEISEYGVEGAWADVIVPTLFLIGQDWETEQKGIEVEHLFSEILTRTMNNRVVDLKKPVNSRPVLLAAVGEELHSLPIYALAAALCEHVAHR